MDVTATTALRRMGNSTGMIVPKALLAALGVEEGERLDIGVENGRMVAARTGGLPNDNDVVLSAEEVVALKLLTQELNAAAERMEANLDKLSARMRESLDPAREAALRAKYEAEIAGEIGPDFFELLGR